MALATHKWSLKTLFIYLVCISCLAPSYHHPVTGLGLADPGGHSKLIRKWHKKRQLSSGNGNAHHVPFHRHIETVWEDNDGILLDNEGKALDPQAFKDHLSRLLHNLDNPKKGTSYSSRSLSMIPPPPAADDHRPRRAGSGGHSRRHINSLKHPNHCVLHGLWLSTAAGAAIELKPERQERHVEIHTKIFELPSNPFPPLLTSQWTGKGIISQESPTTLTIIFQEHIDAGKENHAGERDDELVSVPGDKDSSIAIQLPRTAVFIGQCLVCQGTPMLQGSWVVFPSSQSCGAASGFGIRGINTGFNGNEQQGFSQSGGVPSSQDTIYLLHYF